MKIKPIVGVILGFAAATTIVAPASADDYDRYCRRNPAVCQNSPQNIPVNRGDRRRFENRRLENRRNERYNPNERYNRNNRPRNYWRWNDGRRYDWNEDRRRETERRRRDRRRFENRRWDDRRWDNRRWDNRRWDDRRWDDRRWEDEDFGRRRGRDFGRIENRISRMYRDLTDRNADRGRLRDWADRIARRDWDYNRVRREIADSREARDAIARVYREVVGREPDRRDLRDYQDALRRGWSLNQVRNALRNDRVRRGYRFSR